MSSSLFAFALSGQTIVVLLILGVLLFGRRLPEVGQSLGKARDHVDAAIAHEIPGHFLQRDDVAVGDRGGDTVEFEAPVQPHAEMHIVGHELQFGCLL